MEARRLLAAEISGIAPGGNLLRLVEGGAPGVFDVRLSEAPGERVRYAVRPRDIGRVEVEPSSLFFRDDNFDEPQRVTLTAVDNQFLNGDSATLIRVFEVDGDDEVFVRAEVEDDERCSIFAVIYEDLNGDGIRQRGEPGLPDRPVYLETNGVDGQQPSEQPTQRTAASGTTNFRNLISGTYTVVANPGDGFVQTTSPEDATTSIGRVRPSRATFMARQRVEVGFSRSVVISGEVFEDINGDGVRDAGDDQATPSNALVRLRSLNDPDAEMRYVRVEGGGDGQYRFEAVPPGRYEISLVSVAGGSIATVGPLEVDVSVTAGPGSGNNFGVFERIDLVGEVFIDANGNGLRDDPRVEVPDEVSVRVKITDFRNNSVSFPIRFLDNNRYRIRNIGPGTVTTEVRFNGGANDADFEQTTADYMFSLRSGQELIEVDFGLIERGDSSDATSTDVNRDGVTTPFDALLVINQLRRGDAEGESVAGVDPVLDVNGDGEITPLDVLQVINHLRRPSTLNQVADDVVATQFDSLDNLDEDDLATELAIEQLSDLAGEVALA